ncbi:MAG: lipopolysaccharide biosynthesis protein [Ruminococcaceae bacterium]|nr:lipopolysaccharide biosynthesis protein [Oscillospiraceae bacterium]
MEKKNSKSIQGSMSWSFGAEVFVKLITPITNMALARILAPDAFGVVAVCNMMVSFIDIITDAGFGKYLIQSEFADDEEKGRFANVAFWSNLGLSLFFLLFITLFRNSVAAMLGSRDYAAAISVACIQLVFTSMVSVQTGLLRRKFEFKKLFISRTSVALTPLVIAVPLALVTRSYWALIIGNIAGAVVNATVLFFASPWKPKFYYSFDCLKKMFNFSFWSLCESMAHWMIFWVDTFIVGLWFSDYYLGLYKNSSNMIMSIINMSTMAIGPILLSSLSRIKDEKKAFYEVFLPVEKIVLYLLFPAGLGLFFFRKPITLILFGQQWLEAADVVGAWALMLVVSVAFYGLPAEAYRAKGIPKILFFSQVLYLLFLIPICVLSARVNFWTFVFVRCGAVAIQVVICLLFAKKFLHWRLRAFLKNMIRPLIASAIMAGLCVLIYRDGVSMWVSLLSMVLIVVLYFGVLLLLFRKDIQSSLALIRRKEF